MECNCQVIYFRRSPPWSPAYYNDINGDNLYNDYALGGRNSMRQPYNKAFNLALTRAFFLGRDMRLDVSAQVFNVFNWANQTVTSAGQGDLTYELNQGQG